MHGRSRRRRGRTAAVAAGLLLLVCLLTVAPAPAAAPLVGASAPPLRAHAGPASSARAWALARLATAGTEAVESRTTSEENNASQATDAGESWYIKHVSGMFKDMGKMSFWERRMFDRCRTIDSLGYMMNRTDDVKSWQFATPRCPEKLHPLRGHYSKDLIICDSCEEVLAIGDPVFSCFKCDFDVCADCCGPKAAPGETACPLNHPMTQSYSPKEDFECDDCQMKLADGAQMWSCKICSWDVCPVCAKPDKQAPRALGDSETPEERRKRIAAQVQAQVRAVREKAERSVAREGNLRAKKQELQEAILTCKREALLQTRYMASNVRLRGGEVVERGADGPCGPQEAAEMLAVALAGVADNKLRRKRLHAYLAKDPERARLFTEALCSYAEYNAEALEEITGGARQHVLVGGNELSGSIKRVAMDLSAVLLKVYGGDRQAEFAETVMPGLIKSLQRF